MAETTGWTCPDGALFMTLNTKEKRASRAVSLAFVYLGMIVSFTPLCTS